MKTTKENILAAKALIDTPDKWMQDAYEDGAGCYCAVGALAKALGLNPSKDEIHTGPEFRLLNEASKTLHMQGIVSLNDDQSTTHAQIMEVFDAAADLAKHLAVMRSETLKNLLYKRF